MIGATALAGGCVGLVLGLLLGRALLRPPAEVILMEPFDHAGARDLARNWSEAHERPEAEDLIYDRMQLAWRLKEGRRLRRGLR